MSDKIANFIYKKVTCNSKFKAQTIVDQIAQQFNVNISIQTLYKWLHKLNLSYKKAKKKIIIDKDKFKLRLETFKNEIDKCIHNHTQIISIDEFSIYLEMTPDYGWSIKNEPCEFLVNKKKYRRISVLLAINKYKVVDYYFKEGSINKI